MNATAGTIEWSRVPPSAGLRDGSDAPPGAFVCGAGDSSESRVLCDDDGGVLVLNLTSAGLSGTLPYELFAQMPRLSELNLLGNDELSGELLTARSADAYGALAVLRVGSVRQEKQGFQGNIVGTFDLLPRLRSLTTLELRHVRVSGIMPTAIGDLPLTSLTIVRTDLRGTFPMRAVRNVTHLSMAFNDAKSEFDVNAIA